MFGKIFATEEVDQFADWIVGEVKRSMPPSGTPPGVKNMADRVERLNAKIGKQTREFVQTARLNIYKKARLAARVREGMGALGYSESFIKSFSLNVLSRISSAKRQPR